MNRKLIIYLVYLLFSGFTFAQDNNETTTRSLNQIAEIDTNELKNLYDDAWALLYSNPDSALILAEQHIQLSKQLENYNIEFGLYLKGTISVQLGNPKIALECYYEVLKLNEQKDDSLGIAKSYRDIATVFNYMGEANKSKEYYEKAISFFKVKKEDFELSLTLNNYGISLMKSGEYEKGIRVLNEALLYKKRALKDSREEKEKERLETGIALLESNLGLIYMNQNKTNKALKNLINATKIYYKYDNENYLGSSYFYLAKIYLSKNQKLMAGRYANLTQEIADKTGYIELDRMASDISYQVNEKKGDYKKALSFLENLTQLNDSLYTKENRQALHESEIKYQYEKKAVIDSLSNLESQKVQLAKIKVHNMELNAGRNFLIGVAFILFIIVVLSIILFIKYQKSNEQKDLIQQQKLQVDKAYSELELNKKEIEKKTLETMESIEYARYIQRSLHPEEEKLNSFFDGYFVFNLPKDIVGGDFHWFKSYGDKAIIIAADCTGHGVPGGFITMLGSLLISNTIDKHLKKPDEILTELNKELVSLLKQNEENSIQDGMDISICLVDKKKKTIQFSGARNGIFIINNETVEFYKGSLNPVGGFYTKKEKLKERTYNLTEIKLKKNDFIVMCTDGFYDQFGGKKGMPMGIGKFEEILKDSVKRDLMSPSDYRNYFFKWMGNFPQLDDVLVLGFKI